MKYVCQVCGFIYDPEVGDPDNGVAPGTPFEELPEDWVCPVFWKIFLMKLLNFCKNNSKRKSQI